MKLKSFDDLRHLLPDAGKTDPASSGVEHVPSRKGHDGKGKTVRLRLDTKGRKGKTVTLVQGLQHNPDTLEEIARILKEQCGTGGTVKEGAIELQGDQRARATVMLQEMNYVVKQG
jgi:predicted translation initiation factor SUI1